MKRCYIEGCVKSDLIAAVRPSEDKVVSQHFRDPAIILLIDVVPARVDRTVRPEITTRVYVPVNLRIASKAELRIDSGADFRSRVVGDGGNEDLRKEIGVPPFGIPVAVQTAAARDQEWQPAFQILLRKSVKAIEDRITIDACEVPELCVVESHIEVRRVCDPVVIAELSVGIAQQEAHQSLLLRRGDVACRERCDRHQLAGVRGAGVGRVLRKGGISQPIEKSVSVSGLCERIADQRDVELRIDLVKGAHLSFPDERVACSAFRERRHAEGAKNMRSLVRRREVVDPASKQPTLVHNDARARDAPITRVPVRSMKILVVVAGPPSSHAYDIR